MASESKGYQSLADNPLVSWMLLHTDWKVEKVSGDECLRWCVVTPDNEYLLDSDEDFDLPIFSGNLDKEIMKEMYRQNER